MSRWRWIALGTLGAVILGSLAFTLGSAWYLRSAGYRAVCGQVLSETLGLPSEIGAVVPRSRKAREVRDIDVWLPDRRGKAHTCRSAILSYTGNPADPNEFVLELLGGSSEISTRTWLRSDYRNVLESGLKPGFTENGPRTVRFSDMHLVFDRDEFHARLNGAAGVIDFPDARHGRAAILCASINEHTPRDPVMLDADFSPSDSGVRVDRLVLRVPDLPLAVAGLRDLVGIDVKTGGFSGRLEYSEPDGRKHVVLSGLCSDLDLHEFTSLLPTPWRGRCPEIEVQELRIENRSPRRLRFRGRLADVQLADLLATCGIAGATGTASLSVGEADLNAEGVERLVLSGSCVDFDLESLSAALGYGRVSGRLNVQIDDLTIEKNRVKSLDARIRVAEDSQTPRWIEGELLRAAAERLLHFEPPPILPPRIEYSHFGLRIEILDEELRVYGSHGDKERTVLTIKLLGKEIPLIFEPRDAINASPWLDSLRGRVREALESHPWPKPTSRP
ncbi:MAG: hypothetical protein HZB38_13375 [Planctomycetes bacterium]|nr:hypothetical protein [Planctomycetota bacterium]